MRLLIYSDLHLESHPFTPPPEAVKQADVVVLAGDIKEGGGLASARKMFPDKEIVYVAGNHEFYDTHWGRTLAHMRSQAKDLGIHFLENNEVTLGGVRFLGCTLWTDFLYFGPKLEELVKLECRRHLPDCHAIWVDDDRPDLAPCNEFGFPPKRLITPDDSQQWHRQSRSWLEAALAVGDPATTVVVTHHLPHQRSVARRYKRSARAAPMPPGCRRTSSNAAVYGSTVTPTTRSTIGLEMPVMKPVSSPTQGATGCFGSTKQKTQDSIRS